MNIKLGEIVVAKDALVKIMSADLPVRVSFKLSRSVKSLDKELTMFEEKRIELVKKFAIKDEDGNPIEKDGKIEVNPERSNEYINSLNELSSIDIELDFDKIKLSDIEDVKLSPVEMSLIEKFIDSE